jgi:hypothetical protein
MHMQKKWQIPRRSFLKGLGTALALPALEAMLPSSRAIAAAAASAGAGAGNGRPLRMAFVYTPNGVNMDDWRPKGVGTDFQLPYILEPLKAHQRDLQVFTGLAHDKAKANGDGAGDHARANATFLTGCQARKTAGADIRIGVSVDQVAAAQAGRETRLPSLELGCDRSRQAGACDSGYSCAYQFNFSWKSEATPMPPESDPRAVFDRLFSSGVPGESKEARARRDLFNKSLLDFVLDDAKRLRSNLGANDQRKLDEYLSAVRDLEMRVQQAEKFAVAKVPANLRPQNMPRDLNLQTHMRLMYDLMAVAFETDTTRVATFLPAHDGFNKPYPFLEVAPGQKISEGHHDLSHHQNDPAKKKRIARINRFHIEQFAYFLARLKATKDGDGTLLDNCMIVFGGGISDGNRHNHNDLPVLLAGHGGGTLQAGRHVRYDRDVPMTNLYLAMLYRMGVKTPRLGDSTGPLQNS